MEDIITRPHSPHDLRTCLGVFDGNVPRFFAAAERAEFEAHLQGTDASRAPYVVLIRSGTVVACGGLTIDGTDHTATLSWGMVDREFHGQGLGT